MNEKEILQRAEMIAIEAHAGQTRWDGTPYVNHPIAVSKLVADKLEYGTYSCDLAGVNWYDKLMLRVVALLHDVFEDNPAYKLERGVIYELFKELQVPHMFLDELFLALYKITKRDDITYVQYICEVMTNWFASTVKLADLQHNLSTIAIGAQKDKYEFAYRAICGENFWPEIVHPAVLP